MRGGAGHDTRTVGHRRRGVRRLCAPGMTILRLTHTVVLPARPLNFGYRVIWAIIWGVRMMGLRDRMELEASLSLCSQAHSFIRCKDRPFYEHRGLSWLTVFNNSYCQNVFTTLRFLLCSGITMTLSCTALALIFERNLLVVCRVVLNHGSCPQRSCVTVFTANLCS